MVVLAIPVAAHALTIGALRNSHRAKAAATYAGARLGHVGRGLSAAVVLLNVAENAQPAVSPAMKCITVLTVLYFSVYIAVICARSCARFTGQSTGAPTKFEQVLTEGTESLAPVPMVCIMMICARLRATQLDPVLGNPQPWAQTCMYLCTLTLLFHFLIHLAAPFIGSTETADRAACVAITHKVCCGLVAAVLYGCCAAIIASIVTMRSPTLGAEGTPPQLPMIVCSITLMILYFVLHAAHELVQTLRSAASRKSSVEKLLDEAILTLQYTPMLCILLAGISMRSLQLGLQTTVWANVAMYATMWAIVIQACLVFMIPALLPGEALNVREDISTHCLDWRKHSHPSASCCTLTLCVLWWTSVISLYCGIAVVLVSVIMMEPYPSHLLGAEQAGDATTPISAAMRCVMILTVLYFGIFLAIVICRVAFDSARKKLKAIFESAEQSLAFAPMLCVMMIGVRLRAIQLHIRDPQPWAQNSMYVATWAVVIQVFTAVLIVCVTPSEPTPNRKGDSQGRSSYSASMMEDHDEDPPEVVGEDTSDLRKKFAVIGLLIVRYIAALCLYITMAVLIAAVFAMESAPIEKLSISPDMGALMP